jgi:hypothetical protein
VALLAQHTHLLGDECGRGRTDDDPIAQGAAEVIDRAVDLSAALRRYRRAIANAATSRPEGGDDAAGDALVDVWTVSHSGQFGRRPRSANPLAYCRTRPARWRRSYHVRPCNPRSP